MPEPQNNQQKDYMFVVRKNPKLSVNEISSYFRAREISNKLKDYKNEYFIFCIPEFDPKKTMEQTGETLKIGRVIAKLEADLFKEPFRRRKKRKNLRELEKIIESSLILPDEILWHAYEAYLIGVSVYPRKLRDIKDIDYNKMGEFVGGIVANKLKIECGLKRKPGVVTARNFTYRDSADIRPTDARRKKLHERNLGLLIGLEGNISYIAGALAICDQVELNKRGIYRPSRPEDWKYGMAPNYAKTLVNLSEAKEGDILLDPFCGIGTILQEAALNSVKIFGVDIDEECVESSKENLSWLSKKYKLHLNDLDKRVFVGDARKLTEYFEENSIDAIVTEPYLGPPLKKRPKYEDVKRILSEIKLLYKETIPEMYEILKPRKKTVMIAPSIRSSNGTLDLDIRNLAEQNNFKIYKSIFDKRAHQLVSREIFIFYKPNNVY